MLIEPVQGVLERLSVGDAQCVKQFVLDSVDVSPRGGVQPRPHRGEGDGAGAAVMGIGRTEDEGSPF